MADVSDPDTSKPNAARIYDYWLGGTNNFPADRAAGEAVRRQQPDISVLAVENKQFLTRAVTFVARDGVRQFLDVGSGLPTSPGREVGAPPQWLATHEAAQAVDPGALVAYLDHDPVAVAHSQALLAQDSGSVIAAQADMLDGGAGARLVRRHFCRARRRPGRGRLREHLQRPAGRQPGL